jgi:predicted O-methyltransferase YrrM
MPKPDNPDRDEAVVTAATKNEAFPAGHFYSPVPDFEWLAENASRALVYDADTIAGVDLNVETQLETLKTLGELGRGFDWPEKRSSSRRYFHNTFFGGGSAVTLFAMMMSRRPKRIIEVGSGFSSALMLDTVERSDYATATSLTFIEPFPDRLNSLIHETDRDRCQILVKIVQDVPLAEFEALEAGDFLFIDSSHVARAASDVLYLIHSVLPALKPGVFIHIHDIYWPFEYPQSWLLKNKWAWNEAYFVRAFLEFNDAFEILFFNHFLARRHRKEAQRLFPVLASEKAGSSLWLRRKAKALT